MIDPDPIRKRLASLSPRLGERGRRLFAAAEARAAGYGGVAATSAATGSAVGTTGRGLKELWAAGMLDLGRVRRPGGGRKLLVETDATLLDDLPALVEPAGSAAPQPSERGDPMSPLRWTCKSPSQLAAALVAQGHRIGRTAVGELPHEQKFSLRANRKAREGGGHPDRDAQFVHVNGSVKAAPAAGQPVISVDAKKKGLVGGFKSAGQAWRPEGEPEEVRARDFLIKELGRAVPYGVHGLAANAGWASVGASHDTAAFAVRTIRRWWAEIGSTRHPDATRLQRNPKDLRVTAADGGGGSRPRPWKRELQRLADELGIDTVVRHLPPGTSEWNKVEHRLFSFVTMNWKARPLVSHRVSVDLISATTTDTGLDCPLRTGRRRPSQGNRRV